MKVKVSEATGHVLNWMVEEAQGYGDQYLKFWNMGGDMRFTHCEVMRNYSDDWSQGGPIIHREEINLEIHEGGHTRASFYKMRLAFDGRAKHYHHQHGDTPLIAAMRCFVASKLGDEVDVPDELL